MATSVRSLAVLVIWQTVTVGSGFEFDHAFRKISMENSPELSSMDTLIKRIGLAMGEEEEVEEPLEEHKLLRRVGLGPEDQDAVESMLNTEVSRWNIYCMNTQWNFWIMPKKQWKVGQSHVQGKLS